MAKGPLFRVELFDAIPVGGRRVGLEGGEPCRVETRHRVVAETRFHREPDEIRL